MTTERWAPFAHNPDIALVPLHPKNAEDARIWEIEKSGLVLRSDWGSLEDVRQHELLLDEYENVFGMSNCGYLPMPQLDRLWSDPLLIVSQKIDGTPLHVALQKGQAGSKEAAERVYYAAQKYIVSRLVTGKPVLADIYSLEQYMLPDSCTGPILNDVGLLDIESRAASEKSGRSARSWNDEVMLRLIFMYQDMKIQQQGGVPFEAEASLVDILEHNKFQGKGAVKYAELISRASQENRPLTDVEEGSIT